MNDRIGTSSLSKPKLRDKISDFLFGMFFFELYMQVKGMSRQYNDAFYALLFGEFLGLPLLNSYITLRILPYFTDELNKWSQRCLKEKPVLGLI